VCSVRRINLKTFAWWKLSLSVFVSLRLSFHFCNFI
jgi:hypothetical protein